MRKISVIAMLLIFSMLGWTQSTPDNSGDQQQPPAQGNWQRGGHRGPGLAGTITAITEGSITVKTRDGQTAQVNTSSATQYRKNREQAQLTDFKVGEEVFIRGQQKDGVWQAEVVAARPAGGFGGPAGGGKNFREGMGKQFIVGEVKAINGTQLTILRPDGVSQNITVDENTSFRKDNQSVTLADFKVGDHVFGRGALKNDVFVPSVLNVGEPRFMRGGPDGGRREGNGPGGNNQNEQGPGGPPPDQQAPPQQQ